MSKIKEHFTSRFKDGVIINGDLSQIEVICFAQLCKDNTLIKLLNNGQDIHRYIGSHVYKKQEQAITDIERKNIKPGTFGIIYGNGAPRLSENTGQSIEWCKNFIKKFYELFPMAKAWHNYILEEVEHQGELTLFTGSRLKFRKFPARYHWQDKTKEYYNPPDIKNWPVQHLAQVILALWVGRFFREKAIYKRDKYLLVNTVHDSLMLDCKKEFVDEAIADINDILNKLPSYIKELWNIDMLAPIKGEISYGKSWAEC